jgi:SAM-dependent methyltransferase
MLDRFLRWLRFNLWYFRKAPWDTGVTPPELEAFCHSHPAGKALDLGCGSGTNVAYLARLGWQVVGVDFALRAVEIARRRLVWEKLNGEIRLGDASRTSHHGSGYNLVLDIGCLHALDEPERKKYVTGLRDLLAEGGSFLLYANLKDDNLGRFGLGENEIVEMTHHLRRVSRVDSIDRFNRRAVWIEFVRDG